VQPIALTDAQISAVFAAAHPLPADRRSAFLEDVAGKLAHLPEVGDGVLHRIIMEIQRKHFDPPLSTHAGQPHHGQKYVPRRSAVEA
jgi:hypothetical protein